MNPRNKILVVGGGNIGSRHVQGLALATQPLEITVVEPALDAHDVLQTRYDQVSPGADHELVLVTDLADAPETVDLCIVATTAGPRRQVVDQILASKQVRYLVLEKFLFQARADYQHVSAVLSDAGVPTWVNCPRRVWPSYRLAQAEFRGAGPLAFHVIAGRKADLASNAIHFLDVLDYLTGGGRAWDVRGDRLQVIRGTSRHQDAIELRGLLYGTSDAGDVFSFFVHDDTAAHFVDFSAPGHRWIAYEQERKALVSSAAADWIRKEISFPVVQQSALSGDLAMNLLEEGTCDLPTYAESSALHLALLDAFFEALAFTDETETSICPVT